MLRNFCTSLLFLFAVSVAHADEPKPLKLLFLGDNGHHQPAERFRQLQPVLAKRGIDLSYTDNAEALTPKTLGDYDGLVIYSNLAKITPEQEKALLDYVASGKGFIPLHCASYCFLNSQAYIDLVGAQFKSHATGTFRTTIAEPEHPIMKGFKGFESWDETYVHTKHNEKDRTVLEYRVEKDQKEPWTWVRTHGKGRVFYTAWGHDERTWSNPGFQNLVERGIRWSCGYDPAVVAPFVDRPEMTTLPKNVKPFEYVDAKVPFYPAERNGSREPLGKMQKPLSPEESMKHMVHPKDFELQLFVDESLLPGKPICMNWDERGRLWVACTIDYPNELKKEGEGRDQIVICEDTKGTGKADKMTVFADKLSIPTSLTFWNGGIIVQQAPNTLFLKDTDGDDKADLREKIFTGWNTGDTHAGPSNLHYGLDNWIYGIVGYSGFSGTVAGQKQSFSQGFYRFKPDGSKLEFLRSTNNNSWGVGFSEEGILFGSTANGNPSVYLPIPNRYYEGVRGWSSKVLAGIAGNAPIYPITDKVRQVDWHGHHTAAAGHALYTARSYPPEYWNKVSFVAEPTGHVVSTFTINGQGADFTSRNAWNLLAGNDEWIAPIVAEVGPDGNVWVIDWYNFIVQHNPTPQGFKNGPGNAYITELRDKRHGRIYRLVYKPGETKKSAQPNLHNATTGTLLQTLSHPNMLWRTHAQRLLVERGKQDVVPALLNLVAQPNVDAIGLNPGAIHALWTLHGLGVLDGKDEAALNAVAGALGHRSAGVRRNATLTLPRTVAGAAALLKSKVLTDSDAQVRLAAFLTLAEMPVSPEAAQAIGTALPKPENIGDAWLPDALTSAAAHQDAAFLKGIIGKQQPLPPRALEIVAIVTEHYARGGPVDSIGEVVTALPNAEPRLAEVIVAGLAKGWPKNKAAVLNPESEKAMATLLVKLPATGKGQLLKLASALGSTGLVKYAKEVSAALVSTVANEKQSDEARIAAARQLVEFQPKSAEPLEPLLDAVTARSSPLLATGIIEALGASEAPTLASAMLKRFPGWSPTARAAAIRVLVSRPITIEPLLQMIDKGELQITELSLDQKQALANHPDAKISTKAKAILARGGGLPNADRQKVIDEWMFTTKKVGTASAGKEMFKKHCAVCHQINGEGNKVGPDLTGMAVHPKTELIVHILDPNRSVEGNFRLYKVTTQAGKNFEGLLASETKTSVELIDAQAKKQVILREDIEELIATTKSLMPEGFEKQMKPEEFTNLLEFLTQKGKFVPIPLDKVATVVTSKGMFYASDNRGETMVFSDWKPKTFEGVPFVVVDPGRDQIPNAILLHSTNGTVPPTMPKSVTLPCNTPAKAIHLLSGVSGWGSTGTDNGTVSMIVRLRYEDGKTEDHELIDGQHFADYIRKIDVPKSKLAFMMRGQQQLRYLAVFPKRDATIAQIELVKGSDRTAPIVMAVTVETK